MLMNLMIKVIPMVLIMKILCQKISRLDSVQVEIIIMILWTQILTRIKNFIQRNRVILIMLSQMKTKCKCKKNTMKIRIMIKMKQKRINTMMINLMLKTQKNKIKSNMMRIKIINITLTKLINKTMSTMKQHKIF